jgi:hypothetical protein
MDPDPDAGPDPSIFIIDIQDANKGLILKKSFPAYYFLKVQYFYIIFPKIKSQKEVTKQKKSRFFLLYLLNDRRIRIRIQSRIRIHTSD